MLFAFSPLRAPKGVAIFSKHVIPEIFYRGSIETNDVSVFTIESLEERESFLGRAP